MWAAVGAGDVDPYGRRKSMIHPIEAISSKINCSGQNAHFVKSTGGGTCFEGVGRGESYINIFRPKGHDVFLTRFRLELIFYFTKAAPRPTHNVWPRVHVVRT